MLEERAAVLTETFNSNLAATMDKINSAIKAGASPEELAALLGPDNPGPK